VTLRPRAYQPNAARLAGGWLVVPYDGDDIARVEIGVTLANVNGMVDEWHAAFLGHADGQRVAQIRPRLVTQRGPVNVWLRVNGDARPAGTVTL
jgi:hypothetical protein